MRYSIFCLLRQTVSTTTANAAKVMQHLEHARQTSAAFSPMLGQWIGLALLSRGRQRFGERMRVYDPVRNGDCSADIVDPVFFDPEGTRLRA
jgi:glycine cleavage system aminomethyltransferase T